MTSADLDRLIAQWENATVDFKETLSDGVLAGLSTDIAAFANSQGGLIVFGVANDRRPVGLLPDARDRERISQQARNCRPPASIDFEEVPFGPLKFLVVKVPRSTIVHSDSEYRFPIRIGDTTGYLDALGLVSLLQERGILMGSEPTIQQYRAPLEHLERQEREPLTRDEAARVLKALTSSRRDLRMEGLRDLYQLAYRNIILADPPFVQALEKSLRSGDDAERGLALNVARTVLTYGTDSEKDTVLAWMEFLAEVARSAPPVPTATTPNGSRAMDILLSARSPLVADVLVDWLTGPSSKDVQVLGMFSEARSHGLDSAIRDAMYALLERNDLDDAVKKRVSEVMENVRHG